MSGSFRPARQCSITAGAAIGFHTIPVDDGERTLRPLRAVGPPLADSIGVMRYVDLQSAGDAGFPRGRRHYWKAGFLAEFPDEAVDAFVECARKVTSPLTSVLLMPMGGAIARVADEETPLGLRDSPFNFHAISMWADPADPEKHMRWAREITDAMQPWTSERTYLNFIGDEGEQRVLSGFGADNYRRLAAVKRQYDPHNVFHRNHNIKPA
jgi:FAD/FMN-containing dehydrogenase